MFELTKLEVESTEDNVMSEISTVFDVICEYSIAKEAETSAYGSLVNTAASFSSRESFELGLRGDEDRYMEQFHGEDPKARKKSGEWKYRTYLPSAYVVAKSTVGRAIENGIPLYNTDGSPKGKSALEKEIKQRNSVESEDNPDARAISYAQKLKNSLPNASPEARDMIREILSEAIML